MDRTTNLLGAAALAITDLVSRAADPVIDGRFPAAAFVHLSHCGQPTIESLRRVLGLSHSATVRLVDRMAMEAMVVRVEATWDRRAVALRLTTEGAAVCQRILDQRGQALATALGAALNEDEREALGQLMERLLASLTKQSDDLYRICRLCDFEACPACPVAGAVA